VLSERDYTDAAGVPVATPAGRRSLHRMDRLWRPQWPPLPVAEMAGEARALFAAGWTATSVEGRVCDAHGVGSLVAPATWLALRRQPACVPVHVMPQVRR
jgi:hypothetical protein